ncbi:hypothetical protein GO755_31415 [Spirosoma sp. HMF4905]|uniref:Uncharacterized protein n=1 Tax=Spirosoma arboris TaxID=2682092 RepID=A0A7K1SL93_9BACT|nr:hypothetical protein [Spirosoma arboris]MVM34580.1 hypothetical protein [Spirosoma arboris]
MRYLPDQQFAAKSSKPPILYQGTSYYYVGSLERIYRYDDQGRLILDKKTASDDPSGYGTENYSYIYAGDKVFKAGTQGNDTLILNQLGYAIPSFYLNKKTIYGYDQAGYLLRRQNLYTTLVQVIKNHNVEKQVNVYESGSDTTQFDYNLNYPALFDPRALFNEGRGSTNLLTKSTTRYVYTFSQSNPPAIVSTSYTYLFDEQKRVTRQILFQTNTVEGYLPVLTIKSFTYND